MALDLVLDQLRPMVSTFLDTFQFAYQPPLGVEDAIIFLLSRLYTHLDQAASSARIIFASSFDTIRPVLLGEKLIDRQVEVALGLLDC